MNAVSTGVQRVDMTLRAAGQGVLGTRGGLVQAIVAPSTGGVIATISLTRPSRAITELLGGALLTIIISGGISGSVFSEPSVAPTLALNWSATGGRRSVMAVRGYGLCAAAKEACLRHETRGGVRRIGEAN